MGRRSPRLLRANVLVGPTCLAIGIGICYKILKFSNIVPTATSISVVFSGLLVGEYLRSGETGGVAQKPSTEM